ncbi:MAG: hypothetical protein ACLP0J_09035 [Solirubrobacteraceae bacterium]
MPLRQIGEQSLVFNSGHSWQDIEPVHQRTWPRNGRPALPLRRPYGTGQSASAF